MFWSLSTFAFSLLAGGAQLQAEICAARAGKKKTAETGEEEESYELVGAAKHFRWVTLANLARATEVRMRL